MPTLSKKKEDRLNQLLSVLEDGAVQPNELIEAVEAVMAILDMSHKDVLARLEEAKQGATGEVQALAREVDQTTNQIAELIRQVREQGDMSASEIKALVAKEVKRLEEAMPEMPEMPEGYDDEEIREHIAEHKQILDNLGFLFTAENIRNALEVLPEGEKLAISAIEGLEEELKKRQEVKSQTTALIVSRVDQISDVVLTNLTNGQTLTWDATNRRWINTTAAGSGDMTAAIYDPQNIADDAFDRANHTGEQAISTVTGLQTALDGKQAIPVVVSGNLTAANDTRYINVASATYTDPSPAEGKGFIVFVRNGTATVGGTGYSTAGTLIYRIYHSGAWANYVYNVGSTYATAAQGALADTALQPADVDDTPVNGATTAPVSSNWAFDHEADTSTHGVSGAIVGTTDTQTLSNKTLETTIVNGELRLDATPATDETAVGPTTNTINAGATIAKFELVYLASDGEWALADADASSTTEKMLGIALAAGTDGNALLVALPGSFVRDDTFTWTVGGAIYASTTPGALTQTAPNATDDVVRVVGYATNADTIYFMPQQGVVVV